jgi:DNA-binding response OmpR family regulator
MAVSHHILAVVQSDLPLICNLRRTLELNSYSAFSVARNSQEAILYLRGVGIYQDRFHYPLPTVMILDSGNPDGIDLEVLAWLRENSGFADLPVIILCSEHHASTHLSCMLDPGCFLADRSNLFELVDALRILDQPSFTLQRENLSFPLAPALSSLRGENNPRP